MSRDEVVGLIGTLARSGTAELRRKLAEAKDAAASDALIGQFGIGFYSTFMVADKVTLLTRKAGETTGTKWESTGDGTRTIETVQDAPQGTSVTLPSSPPTPTTTCTTTPTPPSCGAWSSGYPTSSAGPSGWRSPFPPPPPAEGEEPESRPSSGRPSTRQGAVGLPRDEVPTRVRRVLSARQPRLGFAAGGRVRQAEGTFEYEALLFLPTQPPFDLFSVQQRGGIHPHVKRVFIMTTPTCCPSTCGS